MRHLSLLVCILALSAGCTSTHTSGDAPSSTLARWRQSRDYYALLEIVDTHIDPEWNGRVSKADVIKYLGKDIDEGYPNAGPDLWVYVSSRPIPIGSYLYISFGDDGYVTGVSWGSE